MFVRKRKHHFMAQLGTAFHIKSKQAKKEINYLYANMRARPAPESKAICSSLSKW